MTHQARSPFHSESRLAHPPGEIPAALGLSWCFVYGYCGLPAVRFFPEVRRLGGRFTKVYLFWQQLEPERGQYNWSALDAFAAQLEEPDQGLVSLFSASRWATQKSSAMLPPSPAKSLDDYYILVFQLVQRAGGRIRYFQNDAEPNNPVFWSGSREEYAAQLRVFHRAVKDADPSAQVILGGHDGMFVPPRLDPLPDQRTEPFPRQAQGLEFFSYVLKHAAGAFDFFDLRLYGDPYTIGARVEHVHTMMRDAGCPRPIVCTEYGGPNFFEFAENRCYLPLVDAWSNQIGETDAQGLPSRPEGPARQIAELYERAESLPPQTQMFLQGCAPELEAKLLRIQSRQLVMRNVLARAAGVQRTLYWQLPVLPGPRDDLMTLMYGKIGMLRWEAERWVEQGPTASVFRRLAGLLLDAREVRRVPLPDPSVFLFRVDRGEPHPAWVVWQRRDAFSGEDSPPITCHLLCDCDGEAVSIATAFGETTAAEPSGEGIIVHVSDTPLFIESRRSAADRKETAP
ncbi:hypothetical protein DB347_15085 [Opitutaceae bacterium EW11]|nr:hypothetical protein DB347_15085 [Opitutaceae bacterium EW11]